MTNDNYQDILKSLKARGITNFKQFLNFYKVESFSDLSDRMKKAEKKGLTQEESNLVAEARFRKFIGL